MYIVNVYVSKCAYVLQTPALVHLSFFHQRKSILRLFHINIVIDWFDDVIASTPLLANTYVFWASSKIENWSNELESECDIYVDTHQHTHSHR